MPNNNEQNPIHQDSDANPPEKTNALGNFLAGPKFFGSFYKMAALISIALIVGYGINHINRKSASITVIAQTGKERVVLPDGSVATLNTGAEINYPKKFSSSARLVSFSGEGFFQIREDTLLPFILRADKLSLRVLGTSFNIRAERNSPEIEVTVKSGKIAMYPGSDRKKEKSVFANESAVFDKATGEIRISLYGKQGSTPSSIVR